MKNRYENEVVDARDCVIGVWGFGDVAKSYLDYVRILEPGEIIVCDDWMTEAMAAEAGVRKVSLEELFERADVIQLLQSLTEKSVGRIGTRELSAIKEGGVLVNAARAAIVDQGALVAETAKGRFTAILDVHHQEPLPDDSPFRSMPNVILTPHTAGREGQERYVAIMLEEFARLERGEALQYEITLERALAMTNQKFMRH
jgi:phosphoglycerate dehydrogenase-like enzyme